jgi:hypothetical protein
MEEKREKLWLRGGPRIIEFQNTLNSIRYILHLSNIKHQMAAQTDIVARLIETHSTEFRGEEKETTTSTYKIERWMFPALWKTIQSFRGQTVEREAVPQLLRGILMDVLGGSELEGYESDADPQVTFILDFDDVTFSQKRFEMINNLRQALGKEPYTA